MLEMLLCLSASVPQCLADAQHVDRRAAKLLRPVTMIAPPPSTTRQQSRAVRGQDTMRDCSTCWMVRGSFSPTHRWAGGRVAACSRTALSKSYAKSTKGRA